MTNSPNGSTGEGRLSRRRTLITLGTGAGVIAGIGAISGTAAAWERNDAQFNGCSEVWMIVADVDLTYMPPTVAKVIVETADGSLDCRLQEFTEETTTTVPGRYGDAPIRKYAANDGEKVLGVIFYNYTQDEDRFVRESPLRLNPNRCANTPGTPDPRDADCASNTYIQPDDILSGNQGASGGGSQGGNNSGRGNGNGNGNGNN